MVWNWRLLKEENIDTKGRVYEVVSFVSVYYADDKQTIIGWSRNDDSLKYYGDIDFPEFPDDIPINEVKITQDDINKMGYLPVNEEEAKKELRGTLERILSALDKPVLTLADLDTAKKEEEC